MPSIACSKKKWKREAVVYSLVHCNYNIINFPRIDRKRVDGSFLQLLHFQPSDYKIIPIKVVRSNSVGHQFRDKMYVREFTSTLKRWKEPLWGNRHVVQPI